MKNIHSMSIEEINKKAKEVRETLIETVSKNGGHLSSNLGIVELTLCLHNVFDFSKDRLLFDVGHQSYVHKLLTGRDKKFSTLRQRGGIGPFTDPKESSADPFISGHAGTALSAGAGIAMASPEKKVVVVIGDASISNGHSLEALNNIGGNKLKNMIVILNDNEMSIGKNVGSLSRFFGKFMVSEKYMSLRDDIKGIIKKIKANKVSNTLERMEFSLKNFFLPLSMLESLGFKFFGVLDGHNPEELLSTLNKIKNMEGPIFIHVKTQKGKGYSYAEQDKEKFHGISPFDMKTGNTNSTVKTYSSIFGSEIVKLGEDVNKNGYLKKEAIKRTIDCLKKYKEKADKFGASKVIAFATSATRDSQNREEFLSQVRDIGIDIRCIAGEREAQLNFLGNSIVFKDRILVLDIGGGSTEFTLGENGNIEFTKSINIGAVRGTERFFPEQNYTEESIEECRNWIKEMVSGVKFLKDDNFTLVGVAGTATTQISVQKQMEIYDSSEVHLSKINLDELRQNLQLFLSCDGKKRKEIVGLEAKRAGVIIAGTIILIAIMEELGVDSMVVSESDNLNGAMISKEI